ncbi:MAG: carbon-nitrogen family hydrolase [Verrucomicrobiota bacterium]
MKIACCQLDIAWEDKAANYAKVHSLLAEAKLPPGSLVVLPEMFATGFSMNVADIAEAKDGPTAAFVQATAREFGIFVTAGLAIVDDRGQASNHALVVAPNGETLCRYDKIHPFTLGGEADHYRAGSEVVLWDWQGCRVAPFICYDLRFPELFRAAVERGAQMFTVIANWPVKREMHWVTLLQARAIENQAYIIGVNRCGTDPKYVYPGRTVVVDAHGCVRTDAGHQPGLITADIDLGVVESWRKEFPALQDMHWKASAKSI